MHPQPKLIPKQGPAAQKPSTVPSAISALYDSTSLQLGQCTDYLRMLQSRAQCDFSYSPSGSLDK